jgi:hypothetical protein
MTFKPKRIEDPGAASLRPSSAEIAATIGPLAKGLLPTAPQPGAPEESTPSATTKAEPSLMMSFKASKSFARMLAKAAEPEGGLRRLIARVFSEAGYPVPEADLRETRKRRTYD